MKKIKLIIPLLLISLVLTGCDASDKSSVTSADSALANASVEVSDTGSLTSTLTPTSTSTSTSEPSTNEPFQRAELEQMLNVIDEYAYFARDLHPYWSVNEERFVYIPDCVSVTQFFTEDTMEHYGDYYTSYYYKVISGDYATTYGAYVKLSEILTESFRRRYANVRNIVGETYVARSYNPSYPPNKYSITLTTERINENTVVLVFTNNNTVGGDHNPETATLIKGRDGKYRIDDMNRVYSLIPDYFAFDSELELTYGDITINFPSTWEPIPASQTP